MFKLLLYRREARSVYQSGKLGWEESSLRSVASQCSQLWHCGYMCWWFPKTEMVRVQRVWDSRKLLRMLLK